MKIWLVFGLLAIGMYQIVSSVFPGIYAPAVSALRKRCTKKVSPIEDWTSRLTAILAPRMELDPMQRAELSDALLGLGYDITPERFRAQAVAKSSLYALPALCLLLLSPLIGCGAYLLTFYILNKREGQMIQKKISERRDKIERELPQLANTIRQSLNSTHDVVAILENYHKICGAALRGEIARTLNEMKTGNPERALHAFESRISSAPLSELVRGLIGVMRGDDRRIYFDMLSVQYQKAANEAIARELQTRPQKLYPYFGMLFACLVGMVAIALGMYMMQQMKVLFG